MHPRSTSYRRASPAVQRDLRLRHAGVVLVDEPQVLFVQALIDEGPGQARFCWLDTTPPFAGDETVRGGPVEHLAGTRARTVLRVRRNVLGVLPILSNTRAYSVLSLPRQIRSMQPAHHLRTSARKKCLTSRRMKDPPPREWAGAPRTRITT